MKLASIFEIRSLALSPFGIHLMAPSFYVDDDIPFLKQLFNDLTTKDPNYNQKHLKTSAVKPSKPGLLLFFIFRIRIRIFIVPVQVYKEICLTVHSRKQNKQQTNIVARLQRLTNTQNTHNRLFSQH